MPLLSDAKSCFVGNTPVSKIYAGSNLVWPKEVYPPSADVMHYFTCNNTYQSLSPYLPGGLIPTNETVNFNPPFSPDGKLNKCLLFEEGGTGTNRNSMQVDKVSTGEADFNRIHFIEAYAKIGLVAEAGIWYAARLQLSEGILGYKWQAVSLGMIPVPDGTLKVTETMFSSYQNAPGGGYQKITYIPYTEPTWLHFSLSMETTINPSNDRGTLKSYFSVNGIVNNNSMDINGITEQLDKAEVVFDARYKSSSLETQTPEYVLIDEVRTASEPLYTTNFQPA